MNSNTIWKAILHKIRIDSKTRNASRSKNKLQRHAHLRLESLEDRWVPAYGIPNAIDLTATGETVDRGATTGEQSLSADGRYSVFVSSSTNLHVSNYSGTLSGISEVYTRDLHNGVTTLVSISPTGQAANNSSQNAVISADGRYVAFTSTATNLCSGPRFLDHSDR